MKIHFYMSISNTFQYTFLHSFSSIKLKIFAFMFVLTNTVFICVLEEGRIYAHKLSFQGQIEKCICY